MEYSDSLKKNNEFQRVYRKGTSQANRYLVMYVLENHDRHMENRLGISVSEKKLGIVWYATESPD